MKGAIVNLPENVWRSNVLLVDDHQENLDLLHEVLKPLGQNLISVHSGEEALAELLLRDFAVIIIDVRMPGMDGFETVAHIKKRERTKHVPVIFLTAVSDDMAYIARGYSEGAVDYITKPFSPPVLRSKVSVFVALDAKNNLLSQQAKLLEQSNIELAAMAEAAEAATRAKSAFLNMIGHELRTPLTVLSVYAELLSAGTFGEVSDEMSGPLEILEKKSHELGELVEMLLTAAQIESDHLPEKMECIELNDAVAESIDRLKARAKLMGAEVTCELSPVKHFIDFDRTHLARVFDNLLNNALTYGGEHPWIKAHVLSTPDGPTVTIEDHGVGIPKEMQERIFERFVRGEAEGAGPPGSGLGLYITRELLSRRGGTIELVESSPGNGSKFILRFKRSLQSQSAEAGAQSENPAARNGQGLKVKMSESAFVR